MNETEDLKTEIGTEDTLTLKPAKVKIMDVKVEEMGEKKSKIVMCYVKHPDAPDLIRFSKVKYINPQNDKIEISGLWVNKDSENKLRKNSALVLFLQFLKCKTIEELKDKEVEAIVGDTKYLVFKGY